MKIDTSMKALVLEAWDESDSLSVGASELDSIRSQLELTLGKPVTESPARLARMLADEGIPLRHPEVLETDSRWRETQIEKLSLVEDWDFETIESALESAVKIELLRIRFVADADTEAERSLYVYVVEIRTILRTRARCMEAVGG